MKHLMFICALFLSSFSYAQEVLPGFTVKFKQEDPEKLILQLSNPTRKKVNIWISHYYEGTILNTNTNDTNYACRFSFENVEDGRYIITVQSGKERVVKEIELSTGHSFERKLISLW